MTDLQKKLMSETILAKKPSGETISGSFVYEDDILYLCFDNGHLQTKINEGIYHETEGLLEQCIKELEELKPKFDNKNSEIERKIKEEQENRKKLEEQRKKK